MTNAAAPDRAPLMVINAILRQRRVAIGVPLAAVVAALVLALLPRHNFVASSQFMPQASDARGPQLAGLAAQFGFTLGGGTANPESSDFYAELLRSRELLTDVAQTEYRFRTPDGDSLHGTLLQLLKPKGDTPDLRLRRTLQKLRDRADVSVALKTGIVTLQVQMPWPELATQVNRRMLDLVSRYNLTRRQTRAAAERRFVEGRLAEAKSELEASEAELERFFERNRSYQQSPQLMFEANRLQRRVDLRQQVYSSLSQNYENARIEEVRNTPVTTVVTRPEGSAEPQHSNLVLDLFLGLLLGLALALVIIFTREYLEAQRQRHPADYAEFASLRSSMLRSFARPGGRRG
ncbi:MAG TPA: hypothetical protein VFN40_12315 [Gemmatimonadales bacterium]|jgi:uncharacterized protein involved in exopolysaccharide biosynthesis|nr:hypothetical protein [Gemmatimonadales bacterium]